MNASNAFFATATAASVLPAVHSRSSSASMLLQLGAALALGFVMLYAVGFSESPVAHNAAHDARHATGRPCH